MHDYESAFKYYEKALNENDERLELRLDVGILCLKLNLLEEARKKLDPSKFDDEYQEQTLETLQLAADAYRGLAKLELKEKGIDKLEVNANCRKMYAKAL